MWIISATSVVSHLKLSRNNWSLFCSYRDQNNRDLWETGPLGHKAQWIISRLIKIFWCQSVAMWNISAISVVSYLKLLRNVWSLCCSYRDQNNNKIILHARDPRNPNFAESRLGKKWKLIRTQVPRENTDKFQDGGGGQHNYSHVQTSRLVRLKFCLFLRLSLG